MCLCVLGVRVSCHIKPYKRTHRMVECAEREDGDDGENYSTLYLCLSSSWCVCSYLKKKGTLALSAAIGCSACWVTESCLKARCGRLWPLPHTTSLTTWWPSWTSTAWVRVTQLHSSTMWRSTSDAVRPLGEQWGNGWLRRRITSIRNL